MEFSSKATQITFTNQDGDRLALRESEDDADVLEAHIGDESFWMTKKEAKVFAATIVNMADVD